MAGYLAWPVGDPLPNPTGPALAAGSAMKRLFPRFFPAIGVGLAVGLVLSLAATLASGGFEERPPEIVLVAIPVGTADRIARGEATSPIPGDLRLRPGDTLVIRNDDVVGHAFGGYAIAAGAAFVLPVGAADGGRFVCSFHPSGTLALEVEGAVSPGGIAVTSLLVGLPIGLLLGALSLLIAGLGGSSEATAGLTVGGRGGAAPTSGRRPIAEEV